VSDEGTSSGGALRFLKVVIEIIGALTALFLALGTFSDALGLEAVGPVAASAMLELWGDPCDGVTHPAFRTEARATIVDGVEAFEQVTGTYAVEKVAVKQGWAYIEAAPLQGPGSGDIRAYILKRQGSEWTVRWNGRPGAEPGNPTGRPYPENFDSDDQDILRCQTVCKAT